jgi:hypothetical protein
VSLSPRFDLEGACVDDQAGAQTSGEPDLPSLNAYNGWQEQEVNLPREKLGYAGLLGLG